MENLKLRDLYLSLSELNDIVQLVAKKRHIEDYQNKSNDSLYKTFKKQSENKKRIDNIREDLKDLSYKLSKSEYKDIKTNIGKTKKISSNKTRKYLDELDKKILKLDEYRDYDDYEYKGIKNIKDLFKTSINKDYYKPKLINSGYNNNYVEYESRGDRILSIREYLTLIEKYLRELINQYKNEGEWKVQLSAEFNLYH